MSSKDDDAVPGPSNAEIPLKASTSSRTAARKVQFSDDSMDSTILGGQKSSDSWVKGRRQSMVGKSGYVTQLLEEHVEDDMVEKDREAGGRKPIRKQSLEERRASVKAIENDMEFYMRDVTKKPKKSISASKSSSQVKLPTLTSQETIDELQKISKLNVLEAQPSSEWRPSHLLDETPGVKKERSWVGTYIVGKDYWTTEEKDCKETEKKVRCSMDNEVRPWYDMPLQKAKDSRFLALKNKSVTKMDELKEEMDEVYEEKRKQRAISAAQARQKPKVSDDWSEEFQRSFRDVSRGSDLSHRGIHMSMADADKWLEKAGILDYAELTLIHTGFCFLACGGGRHQGLSFKEFTHYLQMISNTTRIPLGDIVRRLTACLRKVNTAEA